MMPAVRRGRGAGPAAARAAPRSSPPSSAKPRRARCSCRERRPGGRSPLWQQRKRAADLLAVAAQFGSFPMLLEAYRECLRDVFDMPALVDTLAADRAARDQAGHRRLDASPSPFASALLFGYVANYIYDGDAPLAERRAQALSIDQAQLRELLGEAELRELLDADALAEVEHQLQQLGDAAAGQDRGRRARPAPAPRRPEREEVAARSIGRTRRTALGRAWSQARRAVAVNIAGAPRFVPVEYAGRYRDALGVPLPSGLPESLLEPTPRRGARPGAALRAHARAFHARPSSPPATAWAAPRAEALLQGARLPPGACSRESSARADRDASGATRTSCSRSAAARSPSCASRSSRSTRPSSRGSSPAGRGVVAPPRRARRAARRDRQPAGRADGGVDLRARNPAGAHRALQPGRPRRADGGRRSRLVRRRAARRARRPPGALPDRPPRAPAAPGRRSAISRRARPRSSSTCGDQGASFFAALHEAAGGGYPGDTVDALWTLVWRGAITNDTFHALRAFTRPQRSPRAQAGLDRAAAFRSRRLAPPRPKDDGRWSATGSAQVASPTRVVDGDGAAAARALRRRDPRGRRGREHHRRLRRRLRRAQGARGRRPGPARLLRRRRRRDAVRAAGRARSPARAARRMPDEPEVVVLAATDPGQPVRHASLKWPAARRGERDAGGPRADADRRLAGGDRQRRPRRVHQPRRAAADVSSCPKTSRRARRPRARWRRGWRALSRPDDSRAGDPDRRDQRHPGRGASAGAVPARRRLQPVRDGLPDPAACLKGTRFSGPARTLHNARWPGTPVVRFESVLPALTRVHDDHPLTGRIVEAVSAPSASTCSCGSRATWCCARTCA